MRIQVSDVVSFGSFVMAVLAYMKVRKKIVFGLFIVIFITALSVSIFSRSESPTPPVKQSANASGTAPINQAGRDINIGNQAGRDINIGISESTMLTLLKDKANARDRELAQKYPLGCVLLGVLSDGKVVYEPGPHSVKFDRNNKITIRIDATTKIAEILIGVFNFTDETDRTFNLDQLYIRIPYLENRPTVLPFGFGGEKRPISAYVEVLDESNAIFVIGFKYD